MFEIEYDAKLFPPLIKYMKAEIPMVRKRAQLYRIDAAHYLSRGEEWLADSSMLRAKNDEAIAEQLRKAVLDAEACRPISIERIQVVVQTITALIDCVIRNDLEARYGMPLKEYPNLYNKVKPANQKYRDLIRTLQKI